MYVRRPTEESITDALAEFCAVLILASVSSSSSNQSVVGHHAVDVA